MVIEIRYLEVSAAGLTAADALLREAALQAAERAYAPYSGFQVGAAALLENGEVVTLPRDYVPSARHCPMPVRVIRASRFRPWPSSRYRAAKSVHASRPAAPAARSCWRWKNAAAVRCASCCAEKRRCVSFPPFRPSSRSRLPRKIWRFEAGTPLLLPHFGF